jgi:hypothetical protein
VRCEIGVGGQLEARWAKLEVKLGIRRRRRHHAQGFNADGLKGGFVARSLSNGPPAEGAPKPDEQRKKHRAFVAIVGKRNRAAPVGSWQGERRRRLARLHWSERCV